MVDYYEVRWIRDTSGECPDDDEGSMMIAGNAVSYTIPRLKEDSRYSITVEATNLAGSVLSNTFVGKTLTKRKNYYIIMA